MCKLITIFIVFTLLPYIFCHINPNLIQQQNDAMKNFFVICTILTIIGFVIGPILLIIILPIIVDPIIIDDDDESIDSSNKRKSKSDSDETSSLIDDDDEEEDEEDRTSF